MKKLFILAIAITMMSCSEEERQDCECEAKVERLISFDQGSTWHPNQTDGRNGEMMPCENDGLETNQVYEETYWYKTVWKCR